MGENSLNDLIYYRQCTD